MDVQSVTLKIKNRQMKRITYLILLLTIGFQAKAQPELTLPFMRDIFQASYINPTVMPEHTFSLGIPGTSVFGQIITNGFLPNNIFQFRNDSMRLSPSSLLAELKDKNLIYAGENVDLFHLRKKVLNGYYWFAIRQNLNVTLYYPKDFFGLAIQGNGAYIGSSLDFSNLKTDVTLYNEFTFGMMKEYPRWAFGGRISLLQGLSNVHFDPEMLKIQIDDDMYGHVAHADAKLYTAGIPKNGEGDPSFDHIDSFSWMSNYLTNFKNKGFALSGGVTYKYDDKTRLSFSFYDLGFITWKDSVQTYTLKGTTDFDGFNILGDWLYGTEFDIDTMIQSMEDDFTRDTVFTKYRTWLNPKFNLTASYDIARRTSVGFSFSGMYNKKLYPALTIGLQQGVGRFFNLIATASINHRSYNNLGLGFMIKPGPVQIFVIADNINLAINPLYTTNVNVRVGLNWVFGRVKQPEGMPFK